MRTTEPAKVGLPATSNKSLTEKARPFRVAFKRLGSCKNAGGAAGSRAMNTLSQAADWAMAWLFCHSAKGLVCWVDRASRVAIRSGRMVFGGRVGDV